MRDDLSWMHVYAVQFHFTRCVEKIEICIHCRLTTAIKLITNNPTVQQTISSIAKPANHKWTNFTKSTFTAQHRSFKQTANISSIICLQCNPAWKITKNCSKSWTIFTTIFSYLPFLNFFVTGYYNMYFYSQQLAVIGQ